MTSITKQAALVVSSGPALAAGFVASAFGFLAASPFGPSLAAAFAEGWLAVFMDAQLFRVLCF